MNFISKPTFSLVLAFVLLLTVIAFESCSTNNVELPCKKGEWYKSVLNVKTTEEPLNVSVKFKDDYVLVELMNSDLHEVYKLHVSEKLNQDEILFETGKSNHHFNHAELKLINNESKPDENKILITFEDFESNLKCENHYLDLKKS